MDSADQITREGREGAAAEVAVITNLERVELRVNRAAPPGPPVPAEGSRILRWQGVPLELGDNEIVTSAVAPGGARLVDRVHWRRIR